MVSFVLSFFPLDVLGEIWDLFESVSEGFLTYSYRKLNVPDQIISKDKEAFKQTQDSDPKLNGIRQRVESCSVTVSRGLNRGET